jgi:hypothetical protein
LFFDAVLIPFVSKRDDPSDKILAYFAADKTKNPKKWSPSGHTNQDTCKNKQ